MTPVTPEEMLAAWKTLGGAKYYTDRTGNVRSHTDLTAGGMAEYANSRGWGTDILPAGYTTGTTALTGGPAAEGQRGMPPAPMSAGITPSGAVVSGPLPAFTQIIGGPAPVQAPSPVALIPTNPVEAKGPGAAFPGGAVAMPFTAVQPAEVTRPLQVGPTRLETGGSMNGNGLTRHAAESFARSALSRAARSSSEGIRQTGITPQFAIPFIGDIPTGGGGMNWTQYFQDLLQQSIGGLLPRLPMPGGGGIPQLPSGLPSAGGAIGRSIGRGIVGQAGRVAKAIAALGAMGIGAELAQQLIINGIVDVRPKRRAKGISAAQLKGFKRVSKLLSNFCAPARRYKKAAKKR